jgi:hypothetical protein
MALPVLQNLKQDLAFRLPNIALDFHHLVNMAILEHAPNTVEHANAIEGLNMDLISN